VEPPTRRNNPHSEKKTYCYKVKQRKKLDRFNDEGNGESWRQIGKKWQDIVRQAEAHSGL
jgi:hypothetical protein